MSISIVGGMVPVVTAVPARAPWPKVLLSGRHHGSARGTSRLNDEMLGGETLRMSWLDDPVRVPTFDGAYLGNFFDGDCRFRGLSWPQ